ncbi:hypothetical protein UlMin_024739, partial [Ulmus minor]
LWRMVGMQQEQGLNQGTKFCTQVASLGMSYGLRISSALPKLLSKQSLTLSTSLLAGGADVDVKRLPKRPAPPRFGRKLTESQKARATHICLDCGYIYFLQKPFDEQPDTYGCPQCQAPKKRFARYDVNTGKAIGGGLPPIGVIIGLVAGIGGVAALLVYGLQ